MIKKQNPEGSIIYVGQYENGNAEGHGSISWPTPKPPKAEQKSPQSLLEAQFAPKEDETEDERVQREAALYAAKKKLLEGKEEAAEDEVKPEDEAANMDLPATTYVGEFRGGLRHGKGKFVQPVKLIVRKPLDDKDEEDSRETEERKVCQKKLTNSVVGQLVGLF